MEENKTYFGITADLSSLDEKLQKFVVLVASQHTSIQTVVIAYLSTCTLHDTTSSMYHWMNRL